MGLVLFGGCNHRAWMYEVLLLWKAMKRKGKDNGGAEVFCWHMRGILDCADFVAFGNSLRRLKRRRRRIRSHASVTVYLTFDIPNRAKRVEARYSHQHGQSNRSAKSIHRHHPQSG